MTPAPTSGARFATPFAYSIAVLTTLGALWLNLQFTGVYGFSPILMFFVVPITISAFYGGFWPGLLALALATASTLIFLPRNANELLRCVFLVVTGLVICAVCEQLRRARGRAEAQQKRIALLADISRRLVVHDAPGPALAGIFSDLAAEIGADLFANHLIASQGDRLELASAGGFTAGQRALIENIPLDESWRQLAQERRPRAGAAELSTDNLSQAVGGSAAGMQAYCGYALVAGGGLLGVLAFGSNRRAQFSAEDLRLIQTVADQVAVAIERHRLLAKSQASETQFRAVVESAPEAIFIQTKGSFAYLNPRAVKLFDATTPAELLGRAVLDSFHPDCRAEVLRRIRQLNEREEAAPAAVEKLLRRSGEVVTVEVSAVPFSYQGEHGALVFAHDVTVRNRAESRLATQSAVGRVLVNAATLNEATPKVLQVLAQAEGFDFGTIWEVDAGAQVLRCSQLWHRPELDAAELGAQTTALTLPAGEGLPGRAWAAAALEWLPDLARVPSSARSGAARAAGLHSALAFPIVAGGAVTGVIEFRARQIAEPDQQLREMFAALGQQLGLFIQRRRAEEEVSKVNAELELRVQERTAQLEAANKELEAFSYSVSHDLRAPLRTVDGFSQALVEDCGPQLSAEGHEHLRIIRRGAQQMGQLIDDLLAFSRLSRVALQVREVNMTGLVADVLGELGAERSGRVINVRVADLPAATGDPALLKRVWFNLLANAFKYTKKCPRADIEVGSYGAGPEQVFFVRDNGAGFDPRYAHKLFGVFQRLHRVEDYEGTGVGLAIVQRIIYRHGGRVWAEGEVDRGAKFSFTLNPQT